MEINALVEGDKAVAAACPGHIVANGISSLSSHVQRLLEAGFVGVLSWDSNGIVVDANQTLLSMLGYTREDIAAGRVVWIALSPAEPPENPAQPVISLHAAGEHFPVEKQYVRRDGTRLPVMVSAAFSEGSRSDGVAFVLDISAQKRAEQEQDRLLAELREAGLRQRRFMKEMLFAFTEGRLRLCYSADELPAQLLPQGEPFALTPQTLRLFRQRVEAIAMEAKMSESRVSDLITGTGESIMNCVRHGGGGTGTINVDAEMRTVQVWIEDQGHGIREEDLHRATLEKGWSGAESFGHGFSLILKTVDRTCLMTGPHGTIIVLEQDIKAPEPVWMQSAYQLV